MSQGGHRGADQRSTELPGINGWAPDPLKKELLQTTTVRSSSRYVGRAQFFSFSLRSTITVRQGLYMVNPSPLPSTARLW